MVDAGSGGYGPKVPRAIKNKVKEMTKEGVLSWKNDYDSEANYPHSYSAYHNKIEYTYYRTSDGWILMIIQDRPWKYERWTVGWLSSLTFAVKKSARGKTTKQQRKEQEVCSWMG